MDSERPWTVSVPELTARLKGGVVQDINDNLDARTPGANLKLEPLTVCFRQLGVQLQNSPCANHPHPPPVPTLWWQGGQ